MISAQQKKKKKIRKTFLETFVSDTDEADSDEDGLEKDVHDDDFLNASMIMNEQQLQQQQQMNIGQSNTSQHKRVRTGSYLPSFVPVKMSTADVLKAVGDGDKELLLAEEDVRGGDFEKGLNKESALKTEETIKVLSKDVYGEHGGTGDDDDECFLSFQSNNVILKSLPLIDDFERLRNNTITFEERILREMDIFGPIASLKITGNGRVAFLAYMSASSAVRCCDEVNSGKLLFYGNRLTASLGTAVVAMERVWPIEDMEDFVESNHNNVITNNGKLWLNENIHQNGIVNMKANALNVIANNEVEKDDNDDGIVHVHFPKDYETMKRIDIVATFVAEDGKAIENRIKTSKRDDQDFTFLFERFDESNEAAYYVWRVFSLANGDSLENFRTCAFRMFSPNGKIWIPPKSLSLAPQQHKHKRKFLREGEEEEAKFPLSSNVVDHTLERGQEKKLTLSSADVTVFDELVQNITIEREKIRNVTTFALEHAIQSEEIISKLSEEMKVAEKLSSPAELQVSLLYALSDVLHNASAPVKHASSYRLHIREALPNVFQILGDSLKSCGVIQRAPFKKRVLDVVRVWREWYIFELSFCDKLEELFLSTTTT